jgi:hypothetical protein
MRKRAKAVVIFLIAVNFLLGSWSVLHGDIYFHTDIARDFLLLEEMVETGRPTLIGERTGIPGLFHGPGWLYLNLPAFWLGKGNPVVVGWFWVFLTAAFTLITYWVGKRVFDERTGLVAALLLSTITIDQSRNLSNVFGATLLSPLLFYFSLVYLKSSRARDLAAAIFTAGLMVQFEMALAPPLLILLLPALAVLLYRKKNLRHLTLLFILPLTLSSFILFDLRHHWLQTRAVAHYFSAGERRGEYSPAALVSTRFREMLLNGPRMLTRSVPWLTLAVSALLVLAFYHAIRRRQLKDRKPFLLFFYLYVGYWSLMLFYNAVVWSYYYEAFLALIVLVIAAAAQFIHPKIYTLIIAALWLVNVNTGVGIIGGMGEFVGKNEVSWQFYHRLARRIFADAHGSDFGYYILTPDLFGYSPRYALNYLQKQDPKISARAFEKKPVTYLLIAPNDEFPFRARLWKENQVRIDKNPEKVLSFANGFRVEKYRLTDKDMAVPADPNLIHDLRFR